MYVFPVLLALSICALIGSCIVVLDAIEKAQEGKGRLDREQEVRMHHQEAKRQDALLYIAYRNRR